MKTCGTCGQELPPDKLEIAGQRAAAEMERLWNMDVEDHQIGAMPTQRVTRDLDCISAIIRRNGWTWALPYRGDGAPQWCGMTAGYAWAAAGLDVSWLRDYFASCYRLSLWARYQKFSTKSKPNPAPPSSRLRAHVDLRHAQPLPDGRVEPRSTFPVQPPRVGDIIIVGDGEPTTGDHVTICMSYKDGVFDTISGNGSGLGPKGNRREGISRRDYVIGASGYRPMWLIRPSVDDLV